MSCCWIDGGCYKAIFNGKLTNFLPWAALFFTKTFVNFSEDLSFTKFFFAFFAIFKKYLVIWFFEIF